MVGVGWCRVREWLIRSAGDQGSAGHAGFESRSLVALPGLVSAVGVFEELAVDGVADATLQRTQRFFSTVAFGLFAEVEVTAGGSWRIWVTAAMCNAWLSWRFPGVEAVPLLPRWRRRSGRCRCSGRSARRSRSVGCRRCNRQVGGHDGSNAMTAVTVLDDASNAVGIRPLSSTRSRTRDAPRRITRRRGGVVRYRLVGVDTPQIDCFSSRRRKLAWEATRGEGHSTVWSRQMTRVLHDQVVVAFRGDAAPPSGPRADRTQPRVPQRHDRHRAGVVRVGLVDAIVVQQARTRRQRRWHIEHELTDGDELLRQQGTGTGRALDRPTPRLERCHERQQLVSRRPTARTRTSPTICS